MLVFATIEAMQFWEWLTAKYVDWRGQAVGQSRTISEFADWIGVSQSLMSRWLKKGGSVPKSKTAIDKLAAKYPDVYSVLGLPAPDFPVAIDRLPPAMRNALIAATRELANTLAERRIDPDSDEAEALTVSIMEKHGFKWTRTVK